VHDEELRAFVPEYVRVDVVGNTGVLFSGNVPRGVLKQLRQAITDSLEAKQSAQPTIAPATAQNTTAAIQTAPQNKVLEKARATAVRKKVKSKK
jgi:hypothetical protein